MKNINIEEVKRYLKRSLKKKVKITTSLIVLFMMSNSIVSMADIIAIDNGKIGEKGAKKDYKPGAIALNPKGDKDGKPQKEAVGSYSIAIGLGAEAKAENSVAIGRGSNIEDGATNSIAIGREAKIFKSDQIESNSNGDEDITERSIAIGRKAETKIYKSIAIGSEASAESALRYNPYVLEKYKAIYETFKNDITSKGDDYKFSNNDLNSLKTKYLSKIEEQKREIAEIEKNIKAIDNNTEEKKTFLGRQKLNDQKNELIRKKHDLNINIETLKQIFEKKFSYLNDKKLEKKQVLNQFNDEEIITQGGEGVSIGSKTKAVDQATSLGNGTYAIGRSSIALGSDDNRYFTEKVTDEDKKHYFEGIYKAVDTNNTTYTPNNLRQYSPTLAAGDGGIAIGTRALSYGIGATSIGAFSYALGDYSTSMGAETRAEGYGAIAVGNKTKVFSDYAVAVGNKNQVSQSGGLAYGFKAISSGRNTIAIGTDVYGNVNIDDSKGIHLQYKQINKNASKVEDKLKNNINGRKKVHDEYEKIDETLKNLENSYTIDSSYSAKDVDKKLKYNGVEEKTGKKVKEQNGNNAIVIGTNAVAKGNNSITLGHASFSMKDNSAAIGSLTYVDGKNSIGLGIGTRVFSDNSLAVGIGSVIARDSQNSLVFGNAAYVGSINSIALGNKASVTLDNSLALGNNSTTDYNPSWLNEKGYVPKGAISLPSSTNVGVISVGSIGQERRITNVAAGYRDTDAVNVSQLKSVEDKLSAVNLSGYDSSMVNFVSVDKTTADGEGKKMQDLAIKMARYKEYIQLKSKLLEMKVRKEKNNETINIEVEKEIEKLLEDEKYNYIKNKDESFKEFETQVTNKIKGNVEVKDILTEIDKKKDELIKEKNLKSILENDKEREKFEKSNFYNKSTTGKDAIAIGAFADATKEQAIAIGMNAKGDSWSVAIGGNTESGNTAVAIGDRAFAKGTYSVSIGHRSNSGEKVSEKVNSKEIERRLKVRESAFDKTKATESFSNSVAIGKGTQIVGESNIAIGENAISGKVTKYILKKIKVTKIQNNEKESEVETKEFDTEDKLNEELKKIKGSDEFRYKVEYKGADNAIAIGKGAKANHNDSVAIGNGSEANSSINSSYLTNDQNSGGRTFAVGGTNIKRRITGVADGSDDSDAVTVKQLKKVGNIIFTGDTGSKSTFELIKNIDIKGATAKKQNNIDIETWDQGDNKHTVENIQTHVSKIGDTQRIVIGMKDVPRFTKIKLGNDSSVNLSVNNNNLTLNNKKITGLLDGTTDSDAVTFKQLEARTKFTIQANEYRENDKGTENKPIEITFPKKIIFKGAEGENNGKTYNTTYATDNVRTYIEKNGNDYEVIVAFKNKPKFDKVQIGEVGGFVISKDNNGFNFNKKKLGNVAPGRIGDKSGDVVVGDQLKDYVKQIVSSNDDISATQSDIMDGKNKVGVKYTLGLKQNLKDKINKIDEKADKSELTELKNKEITFIGDTRGANKDDIKVKLGEEIQIKAEDHWNYNKETKAHTDSEPYYATENLSTYYRIKNGKKQILIGMKDKPRFEEIIIGKVTENRIKITKDEISITKKVQDKVNNNKTIDKSVKIEVDDNGSLKLDSKKITGLADGTDNTDAVNMQQLNALKATVTTNTSSIEGNKKEIAKKLNKDDIDVTGDDKYITVTPSEDKGKKTYKVAFDDTKLTNVITNNIDNYKFSENKSIQDMLGKKADKDAGNLNEKDITSWQNKLGNGTVAKGDTKLVKGDTVFTYVNNIANTIKQELSTKATGDLTKKLNTNADNLTETGVTNLTNTLGKGEVADGNTGLVNGGVVKTYVDSKLNDKLSSSDVNITGDEYIKVAPDKNKHNHYALTLDMQGLGKNLDITNNQTITNINTELGKKANIDASNLGDAGVTAWQGKLGTGTISNGDTGLVTGGVVKSYIDDQMKNNLSTINTSLSSKLSDITIKGDKYINTNKVNSSNYEISLNEDELNNHLNSYDFKNNTTIQNINSNIDSIDNLKANKDASNIDPTTWITALGLGNVNPTDQRFVTGAVIHNFVTGTLDETVKKIDTKLDKKLDKDGLDIKGDSKYITVTPSEDKTKKIYTVSFDDAKLTNTINDSNFTNNKSIQDMLGKKADLDGTNLKNINLSAWQSTLGTGKVATGDTGLVTGDTVFSYINPIDTKVNQLSTSLNDKLSDITINGDEYIKTEKTSNSSYNLSLNKDSLETLINSKTADLAKNDTITNINKELDKKANLDASNLKEQNIKDWQTKLGDGKVDTGNTGLVNGGVVKTYVDSQIKNNTNTIDTKLDKKLDKDGLDIKGDSKYITVTPSVDKTKKVYTVAFNNTKLTNAITGSDFSNNTSIKTMLDKKADLDGTNLKNINLSVWQSTLGTGKVEDGNTGLVTGQTVFKYIDPIKTKVDKLGTDLNDKLSDITITGDEYIKTKKDEKHKGVYALSLNKDSLETLINSKTADLAKNDTITNINKELDKKANLDASNLKEQNVKEWQAKLGNGKVDTGNTGLVNGGTVKEYVDSKIDNNTNTINTKLDTKLNKDDLDVTGDDKYITVTNEDSAKKKYKVSFNETNLKQLVNDTDITNNNYLKAKLDDKADKNANNLTETDVTKWQEKLGNGSVAKDDTKLVKGDTVFTYVNGVVDKIKQEISTKSIEDLAKKLNVDAKNITTEGVINLTNTLGTGKIEDNNNNLVTGGTVKKYITSEINTINNKVSGKLSSEDVDVKGDEYISVAKDNIKTNHYALTLDIAGLGKNLDLTNNSSINNMFTTKLGDINTNIGDLTTKIDNNTNSINSLTTKVDGNTNNISNLTTKVETNTNDITTLKQDITNKLDIDAKNLNDAGVTNLTNRLGTGAIEDNNNNLVTGGTVKKYITDEINTIDNKVSGKLSSEDVNVKGDEYINVATDNAKTNHYTLTFDKDKLATDLDLTKNTKLTEQFNKYALLDGSNLENINLSVWQAKLGNGAIASGNTGLVKGGDIFTYVNNIKQELNNQATLDLSNKLDKDGSNLDKTSLDKLTNKLSEGSDLSTPTNRLVTDTKVSEALKNKLDVNANNLTKDGVTNLTNKLGTGKVAENNTGLVTGGKVYEVKKELNKSISTNTQNITELDNKYTTLNNQVTTNTSDIKDLQTTVNGLKNTTQEISNINTKLGDINNNITNINTKLDDKLDKSDLSIKGDKYIDVKKDNKFNYTLSFNKTKLENDLDLTNNNSINTMFTNKLGDINTNIGDLTTKVETNTNSINSLKTTVEGNTNNISNLTTKVETNTKDIDTLKQDMTKKLNVDADNLTTKGETNLINKLSNGSDISKPNNKLVTDTQVNTYLSRYNDALGVVDKKSTVALEKSELALGGVANAVAMANLVQVNSYSRHRHNLSAAYGYYGGSHALAVGISGTNEERNFVYKLSGSVNNKGNLAFGVGAGVMLGEENENNYPEKVKKVSELENKVKKQEEEINKLKKQAEKTDMLEKQVAELMKLIKKKK